MNWNDRFEVELWFRHDESGKEWRWRAVSVANRKIVASGEGYHNKADMLSVLEGLFPEAEIRDLEDHESEGQ